MKRTVSATATWIAAILIPMSLTVSPAEVYSQAVSNSAGGNATGEQATELGEIVVTAQKREQRLQDVGMSLVVATGAQLIDAGVVDITDLPQVVSALNVGRSQFGFPILSLRGVNLNVGYMSAQPTVSTYVDQALLAYPAMTEGVFLDVERIEVLKGPQGTLFGANVTGGAINIIDAKPTNFFTAGARTEINNFGGTHLEAYVGGPLSDTLRARTAVSTDQWGAWQKCYYGCDEKNGSANRANGRMLFDWTPTDDLKVSLNLNGNYDHGEPQMFRLQAKTIQVPPGYPGLATYPLPPNNDRAADFTTSEYPSHKRDQTYQAVLRTDYDLGGVTLTSLTDYANTRRYVDFDGDATALPLGFNQSFGSISSFNQEGRISGKLASPAINYVVGASYQNDNIQDDQSAHWDGYSGIPLGADALIENPVHYRSTGIFASDDWQIVPKLTLTTGARYAWLEESTKGCFADGGNGILAGTFQYLSNLVRSGYGLPPTSGLFVPGGCIALDDRPQLINPASPSPEAFLPYNANLSQNEHNISWKTALNYKPTEDSLIYGLVSRGFKAGEIAPGYNTVASQFVPIKQEELTDYEVGAKGEFLERTLDVNGAVFYYDYKDKQFLTLEPGLIGDQFVLQNIPKSSVKGVEGDIVERPMPGLTVRAAVSYIKTAVGAFTTYTGVGHYTNIDGNPFNLAPKLSGNFDVEYRVPVRSNVEAFTGVSGAFNSSTYADLGETAAYRLPEWVTVDARLGVDVAKTWNASIWVRNLADRFYINNITTGNDVLISTTGMPRTFGVAASYKFH